MKILIELTVTAGLFSGLVFGSSRNIKSTPGKYLDTLPKKTDTSYAQKQNAFDRDIAVIPHFDTLTANGVFKQTDSMDYANKLKTDSLQKKKSHPVKRKK